MTPPYRFYPEMVESYVYVGENKWYTIGDSDWVPITKDTYGEILFKYSVQADELKPVDEYYLR